MVQELSSDQGVREDFAQKGTARAKVICRFCGSDRVYRLFREGFLQKGIYPIFGFYPWRCKNCTAHMMLRKRKRPKRVGQVA